MVIDIQKESEGILSDFQEYFSEYKRSMIGKDDCIFLVNDASNEIRQHYDVHYDGITFDDVLFKKMISSKRRYLKNKSINYEFFVIPDKSLVLRELLPFATTSPFRCVDKISHYVVDLVDIMNAGDYQYDDTHIMEESAVKIVSYILNNLHPELSVDEYKNMLKDKLTVEEYESFGDLLFPVNWTWDRQHPIFKKYYASVKKRYKIKDSDNLIEKEVPPEFDKMGSRKTLYYTNDNSITNKKAIILRDSTTDKLIDVLSAYYGEIIFYWDHYYFDKDLVEFFNPDDIIEIRTERFIANPINGIVKADGTFELLQKSVKIKKLEFIKPYTLHLWVDIPVLRIMPLDAQCDIMLNGNLLSNEVITGSSQTHLHYFLNNYPMEYRSNELKLAVRIKKLIKRD